MTKLHDLIRRRLAAPSGRWYDDLAEPLAEDAWRSLARSGIDRSNYGSSRVLTNAPETPRMGGVMADAGLGHAVALELYDAGMLARYGTIGLREPRSTFDAGHFEASFRNAMAWIDLAPGAASATRNLIWSVTPVDVDGPEYDTGYSDPGLPFSIFIGAHDAAHDVPAIRLAEGILHETMHLQLSLIEGLVPLIASHEERRHSPWQMRPRPTQGVLHGLYVFKVIQDWLGIVMDDEDVNDATGEHCRRRLGQIAAECAELHDLATSQDLTPDGRAFVTALLN